MCPLEQNDAGQWKENDISIGKDTDTFVEKQKTDEIELLEFPVGMAEKIREAKKNEYEEKVAIMTGMHIDITDNENRLATIPYSLIQKALQRKERFENHGISFVTLDDIESMKGINNIVFDRALQAYGACHSYGIHIETVEQVADCWFYTEEAPKKLSIIAHAFTHFDMFSVHFKGLQSVSVGDLYKGCTQFGAFKKLQPAATDFEVLISACSFQAEDCGAILNHMHTMKSLGYAKIPHNMEGIHGFGSIQYDTFIKAEACGSIFKEVFKDTSITVKNLQQCRAFCLFLERGGYEYLTQSPLPDLNAAKTIIRGYYRAVKRGVHVKNIVREETVESFLDKVQSSIEKKIKRSSGVPVNQIRSPEEVQQIDKMFRLGEYANDRYVSYDNNGQEKQRVASGYRMQQKTANCYKVAPLHFISQNDYLAHALREHVKVLDTAEYGKLGRSMSLPFEGGNEEIVFRDELGPQKMYQGSLEEYYESLTYAERYEFFAEVALREYDETQRSFNTMMSSGLMSTQQSIMPINEIQRYVDAYCKKSGPDYEYLQGFFESKKMLYAVDAPLGYKIIEALLLKRMKGRGAVDRSMERSDMVGKVLDEMLSDKHWNTSLLALKLQGIIGSIDRAYAEAVLQNIGTSESIVIAQIQQKKQKETDSLTSPYFYFKGKRYAQGHAYPVVGYDHSTKIVTVMNTWDIGNHAYTYQLSLNDFFGLFEQLRVAERKDNAPVLDLTIDF